MIEHVKELRTELQVPALARSERGPLDESEIEVHLVGTWHNAGAGISERRAYSVASDDGRSRDTSFVKVVLSRSQLVLN